LPDLAEERDEFDDSHQSNEEVGGKMLARKIYWQGDTDSK